MPTWRLFSVALVVVALSAPARADELPAADVADEPPPRTAWVAPVVVVRRADPEPLPAEQDQEPPTDITLYPWRRLRFEIDGGGLAGLAQIGGRTANDSAGFTIRAGVRDGRLRLVADCSVLEYDEGTTVMASDGTELRGYRDDGSSVRLDLDVRYAVARTTTPHVDELHPALTYETNRDVWLGVGFGYDQLSFDGMSAGRKNAMVELGTSHERVYERSHYGYDFGVQLGMAASPAALVPGGGVDLSLLFVTAFHFGN